MLPKMTQLWARPKPNRAVIIMVLALVLAVIYTLRVLDECVGKICLEEDPVGTKLRKKLDETFPTAAIYYRTQRPLILASAKRHWVHWCWHFIDDMAEVGPYARYEDLVELRFKSLAMKKRQFGRHDLDEGGAVILGCHRRMDNVN